LFWTPDLLKLGQVLFVYRLQHSSYKVVGLKILRKMYMQLEANLMFDPDTLIKASATLSIIYLPKAFVSRN